MRVFRNHGITTDHRQRAETGGFFYEMVDLGYNYRITDFQCALGISQLRKLPDSMREAPAYSQRCTMSHFAEIDYVTPLAVRSDAAHAYHLYMVQFDTEALECHERIYLKRCEQKISVSMSIIFPYICIRSIAIALVPSPGIVSCR